MKRRLIYTLMLMYAVLQASAQTYTYDSNNRLSKVEYANGITVTYTYDALGNRTGKKVIGGSDAPQEVSESGLPGDFNNNGKWDAEDVDYLSQAIMENKQPTASTDLNQDDKLNVADVVLLLRAVNQGYWPFVPEYVDLGLPSGTLWATCNVGAMKPEDVGGYYAWGETQQKETYDYSTYVHCDGTSSNVYDIGSDISGTEYDVARKKWGDEWAMPNKKQIDELYKNCTVEETTLNGTNGILFTGTNGSSIFLPACGSRSGSMTYSYGSSCDYWSSEFQTVVPTTAYYWGTATISKGRVSKSGSRSNGLCVRPIKKAKSGPIEIDLGW